MGTISPVELDYLAEGIPEQTVLSPLDHLHSFDPQGVERARYDESVAVNLSSVDTFLHQLAGSTPAAILDLLG